MRRTSKEQGNALSKQHHESVLLITLDSCRYDAFAEADLPCLKGVGPLHQAMAPGYFTYSSHAAIFMGFTPGVAGRREAVLDPKYAKLFKIAKGGYPGAGQHVFLLKGRSIINGFERAGYRCLGSGAVKWFDPRLATGRILTEGFHRFYYPGNTYSLDRQVQWIEAQLHGVTKPVFLFLNVGETHVPYYHQGADWSPKNNPCRPFAADNDAQECRRRQRACLEYLDWKLSPLLEAFGESTIMICGDHGDCWGEDGLWEHGFSHPKVLEVPLVYRICKH